MIDQRISPGVLVRDGRGRIGTVVAVRAYANSATVDFGEWRKSVVRLDSIEWVPRAG